LNLAVESDPGAYAPLALVEVEMQLREAADCYTFLLVDSDGNGLYTGASVTFTEKGTGHQVYSKVYNAIHFDQEEVLVEVDPTVVSVPTTPALDNVMAISQPR
jgi:hypothetical protein